MALRNLPYLPLYVDDYTSDEKLNECSAATQGVYVRIMCLMTKSENYGVILLKQKHKQTDKQINNFASQLAKNIAFDFATILPALIELIEEKVLLIQGDSLIQKRMLRDAEISDARAENGKKGGDKTQSKTKKFAKVKSEANTGLVMDNGIGIDNEEKKGVQGETDLLAPESDFEVMLTDTAKFIIQQFGWSEHRDFSKLREAREFLVFINQSGQLEWFKEQYPNYFKYKSIATNEGKHNLTSFLGTVAKEYTNGGWNAAVWSEKIKNYSHGKNKQRPDLTTLSNLSDAILANAGINIGGADTQK